MHETQEADPRTRRWAVLLVICGTFAGLAVTWLAESCGPALKAWIERDPEQMGSRLRLAFAGLALAVALPVLGLAGYFWRLGVAIVRAERFPAPGTRVMRDTVVLRGAPARRRGRLMQLVAVLLAAALVAFAVVFFRLVSVMDSRPR